MTFVPTERLNMAKSKRKVKTSRKKSAVRSRTSKQSVKKVELKYIPWNAVELEDLNPLLQRQFVVGQEMMLARVLLKKGCIVPEHSHHNEQITYVLEGALKFWIDGKVIVVNRPKRWPILSTSTSSVHRVPTGSTRPINICALKDKLNLSLAPAHD